MLTQDEVQHIANLAKIKLSDEEVTKYQKELSSILDFFATLESAPTDGVAETSQVAGLENAVRPDVIELGELESALVGCTPHQVEGGLVKIPKIM